jgi:tyrosyl-tRNA synthetase
VDDADVLKCLKMLTFLPLEEIRKMESWEGAELNRAKEILAHELTELVHGKEEADKAEAAAKAVFSGAASENMPTYEVKAEDYTDGSVDLLTILVNTGLCTSRGDARRNVEQGGVTAGEEKVTDPKTAYTREQLADGLVIRRGKKKFVRVIG